MDERRAQRAFSENHIHLAQESHLFEKSKSCNFGSLIRGREPPLETFGQQAKASLSDSSIYAWTDKEDLTEEVSSPDKRSTCALHHAILIKKH